MERTVATTLIGAVLVTAVECNAGFLTVHGGQVIAGHQVNTQSTTRMLSNSGIAIVSNRAEGPNDARPTFVSKSGSGELLSLSASPVTGAKFSYAYAISHGGTIVGFSELFTPSGSAGYRPVRWDSVSAAPVVLQTLQNGTTSQFDAVVRSLNDIGVGVGFSDKHVAGQPTGQRAVRWDLTSGGVVELDNSIFGVSSQGSVTSSAEAVNDAGVVVGYSRKYNAAHQDIGNRGVRWSAGGAVVEELPPVSTRPNGYGGSSAAKINALGDTIGQSSHVGTDGFALTSRATLWRAGTTAPIELPVFYQSPTGDSFSTAFDINDSGTIVGFSWRPDVNGAFWGPTGARWDSATLSLQELPWLGVPDPLQVGGPSAGAFAVNSAGIAVGWSTVAPQAGNEWHATMWDTDNVPIDLNSLIDPNSGWVLTQANAISDTGWIAGMGLFDPDGTGSAAPYARAFLMQVPEPGLSFATLLTALSRSLIRRTRSARVCAGDRARGK